MAKSMRTDIVDEYVALVVRGAESYDTRFARLREQMTNIDVMRLDSRLLCAADDAREKAAALLLARARLIKAQPKLTAR
jgi:hypothetical protein